MHWIGWKPGRTVDMPRMTVAERKNTAQYEWAFLLCKIRNSCWMSSEKRPAVVYKSCLFVDELFFLVFEGGFVRDRRRLFILVDGREPTRAGQRAGVCEEWKMSGMVQIKMSLKA